MNVEGLFTLFTEALFSSYRRPHFSQHLALLLCCIVFENLMRRMLDCVDMATWFQPVDVEVDLFWVFIQRERSDLVDIRNQRVLVTHYKEDDT